MTITIDRETIEQIQADEGLPQFAHCTPLDGTAATLPTKTAPVSGRMTWTWKTVGRRAHVDGARVRLGTRIITCETATPMTIRPGDSVTIEATLAGLNI